VEIGLRQAKTMEKISPQMVTQQVVYVSNTLLVEMVEKDVNNFANKPILKDSIELSRLFGLFSFAVP
jgi:hypothetical protein